MQKNAPIGKCIAGNTIDPGSLSAVPFPGRALASYHLLFTHIGQKCICIIYQIYFPIIDIIYSGLQISSFVPFGHSSRVTHADDQYFHVHICPYAYIHTYIYVSLVRVSMIGGDFWGQEQQQDNHVMKIRIWDPSSASCRYF